MSKGVNTHVTLTHQIAGLLTDMIILWLRYIIQTGSLSAERKESCIMNLIILRYRELRA